MNHIIIISQALYLLGLLLRTFLMTSPALSNWKKQTPLALYTSCSFWLTKRMASNCLPQYRCNAENEEDKKVISLQLDKDHHTLYVAFSSCVIRIPLSRCERYGSCKKWADVSGLTLGLAALRPWVMRKSKLHSLCFCAGLVLHLGTHTVAGC